MKKYVSIFLALLLAISFSVPAFADDVTYNTNTQGNVMLLDGDFGQKNLNDADVTYSELEIQISNELYCTMEFILRVKNNTYPIAVAGMLEEYDSDANTTILHGCLRGDAFIDNTLYHVTIGLTKETGKNNINAGVVLMPAGDEWSDDVIILSMGDYVVTPTDYSLFAGDDMVASISSQTQEVIDNAVDVDARIKNAEAQSVGVRVSFDTNTIFSYLYEHFGYSSQGGGVTFSISEVTVGVRHFSNLALLGGLYSTDAMTNIDLHYNRNDQDEIFWAIIFDALGYFSNIETATLNALINSCGSKPSDIVTNFGDNQWVTFRGNDIYDNMLTLGVACTFGVGPTPPMSSGTATITGYGNATFHVRQNIPLSGAVSFYIDTSEETDDVTVTFG